MKIEKGIPIPKKGGFGDRFPWDKMEVGDSFFVPVKGKIILSKQSSVSTSARIYCNGHKLKWKFTTRAEKGGFRIWRIK